MARMLSTGDMADKLIMRGYSPYSREYTMMLLHRAAENREIRCRALEGQRRTRYLVSYVDSKTYIARHYREIHG